MAQTVVLDNGAANLKVGLSTDDGPRIVPNCCGKAKNERRRLFIGDQLNECKDYSGLFYILPFQKGYLVNWDVQRKIWDHVFSKECLNVDLNGLNLVLTEPQYNFTSIKECMDEILFEDYKVNSLYRITGLLSSKGTLFAGVGYYLLLIVNNVSAQLSSYKWQNDARQKPLCSLVVDSGFSFSHIVPICDGKIIKKGIRRVNVGGKMLTNHLKEILSYRQLHVMDETYVINQVKEDCCFVSEDFGTDMRISRKKGPENTVARDYVLPDYTNVKRGYIRPVEKMWEKHRGEEQLLRMNNERFTVPEILFNPSDIGIQEMGLAEAVVESITSTNLMMQPHLYMNIVITGGNALIPGFINRITNEIRSLAPIDFDVEIFCSDNPLTYSWHGGAELSQSSDFIEKFCVTKSQYEEHGRSICSRKFEEDLLR